ncbi:MAG: hypothetical protein DRP47_00130 [Candidatus Zixiibacteriota bacterium]|nr:MAG: hypothetical protein DRP47_00130 [candidate division Zixibacteria bacterium]
MDGWHLEYDIDVDKENGVVYEKIFGVFLPDTAMAYLKDFEEQVSPITAKPWVKLADLTNWKTAHPEGVEIIGKHLHWCRGHNMKWSVNIINNPVTYSQLNKMFNLGGTSKISKTFRTIKEGENFLRKQGFKIK